ncbi:MAG TPA: hypothetical protein VNA14_04245 [Mycobacteriales bacterium]|nr:hypothetical protein [Mycobacteriales bacterium]
MSVLLALLAVAATGGIALWTYQQDQKRRAALAQFALAKAWTFEPDDRRGLVDRWSEPPFGIGHSRRASNVMSGVVSGRPMLAFDYRYKVTTSTGKSRSTRTYKYGVCVLGLPTYLPPLEVGPENLLTRFGSALGIDDIELESEDFNRAFRVRGAPRFAHDVLTPRTMETLLRSECRSWRIAGSDILAWDDGLQGPVEILSRLATLDGVVTAIPDFVWKDHGVEPPAGK